MVTDQVSTLITVIAQQQRQIDRLQSRLKAGTADLASANKQLAALTERYQNQSQNYGTLYAAYTALGGK